MKKIIILGAGGHAKVIADSIEQMAMNQELDLVGYLDDKYRADGESVLGKPILGRVSEIEKYAQEGYYFVIGIGSNALREKFAMIHTVKYFTVVHPSAVIAKEVEIGQGSVVMANCVINSGSKVGVHTIINTSTVVEHDCIIESYVHLSPRVVLGGGCRIGRGSWIGIGSTVIHLITVGSNTLIGAGSVVVKNIGSDTKAYGVPCREVKR